MGIKSLAPVFALLLCFVILCLGHGLQSVLLPARATLEEYSEMTIGFLMSAYYAGFIIGTFLGPVLIARVGHIHVFAAMAASAAAIMLCFPLTTHPILWILLRFLYGLCLVHLYTVMESWLNGIGDAKNRGRILSVYMILNFLAMSGGQLLFSSTSSDSFQMFSISSILISLSLVPLLLSRITRPSHPHSPEVFGVKQLLAISPLGVVGAAVAGLAGGAYWGFTAPYIIRMGFPQNYISLFMAVTLFGGLIAQWPLGMLSDHINRRWVILISAGLMCVSAGMLAVMAATSSPYETYGLFWLLFFAAIFGAGFHPLYSLCIAHANDFVPHGQFVRASASLQLVQSIGAMAGPLIAGWLVHSIGNAALYGYIAAMAAVLCAYTLARLFENRIPKYFSPFHILARTGATAFLMDPRYEKDGK